jgi:signal transduction histidine kinase
MNAGAPVEIRWRPLFWDIAPVAALVLVGLVTVEPGRERDLPLQYLVVAPLLLRRVWPIPVLVTVSILAGTTSMGTPTPWVQVGAVGLASYTAGELAEDRFRTWLVVAIATATITLALIVQDADAVESVVITFTVLVPAWLLGDIVRQRRLTAIAKAEAGSRAIREAEERVRAGVAEERRAMAREMHDVVAHGVSVMVIQAGAARQVVEESPERASEALLTVEATGREVMSELRRLLGVLDESDEGAGAGVAPQPGVDQISVLLERVREAGLPAELEVAGTPRPLSPSLDVTAYRIVQEALTNALRYAQWAATLVRLVWEPSQLRIEILDDGPAAPPEVDESAGHGLVGMRERASRVGGRLEAGPRLGGGYAVRAWLPLGPERS